MVDEDWQTASPHAPNTALRKASSAVSWLAGSLRQNLLPYAFALALLLAPLARGRDLRAILFALIVMAVQWAQMAITVNAGEACTIPSCCGRCRKWWSRSHSRRPPAGLAARRFRRLPPSWP